MKGIVCSENFWFAFLLGFLADTKLPESLAVPRCRESGFYEILILVREAFTQVLGEVPAMG